MGRSVNRTTGAVSDTRTGELLKAGWGGPWLGSMAHHNKVQASALPSARSNGQPPQPPQQVTNPREAVELANRLVQKGIVAPDPTSPRASRPADEAYPSEWLGLSDADLGDDPLTASQDVGTQTQEPDAYPPEWLHENISRPTLSGRMIA